MGGQQVAVVAPTTLLARQHYTNFVERFAGFPLKVGRLSRLVPSKEMAETREGLASGDIDKARTLYERALSVFEATVASEHPYMRIVQERLASWEKAAKPSFPHN